MRAHAAHLGLFVPGNPTLPPQPAGIGRLRDFVPAAFSLPPQPAGIGGLRDFVAAAFTLPPQPAGIGTFVPTASMWPITQNSVLEGSDQMTYVNGLGHLHGAGDCGCGGSCGGCGHGMSGISTDITQLFNDLTAGNWSQAGTDFMTLMEEPVVGTVPLWVFLGGGLFLWAFLFSGGEHSKYQRGRRASAAARRAYA